jgi:hypothetical protein
MNEMILGHENYIEVEREPKMRVEQLKSAAMCDSCGWYCSTPSLLPEIHLSSTSVHLCGTCLELLKDGLAIWPGPKEG